MSGDQVHTEACGCTLRALRVSGPAVCPVCRCSWRWWGPELIEMPTQTPIGGANELASECRRCGAEIHYRALVVA